MKKLIPTIFLIPTLLLTLAQPANAASVNYYQTTNDQAQLAYLYSVVAQLQAQLNALLKQQTPVYYSVATTYPNTSYNYNYNDSNGISAVTTQGVSLQNNSSVELQGTVTFSDSRSGRVWFEYGNSNFLNYSSQSATVNGYNNNLKSFTAIIPDLNNGTTYYYKAVAEDSNGRIIEGATKSFIYNGNNYYNNSNYYNNNYNYNNNNRYNNWTLNVTSSRYYNGDSIRVEYSIPNGEEDSNNWIGLYRVGDSDSNYVSRQYLSSNNTDGYLTFRTYNDDEYEFRLFSNNNNNREARSDSFDVRN